MFERWAELQGAQGQESREPDVKALKLNAAPAVGWRLKDAWKRKKRENAWTEMRTAEHIRDIRGKLTQNNLV